MADDQPKIIGSFDEFFEDMVARCAQARELLAPLIPFLKEPEDLSSNAERKKLPHREELLSTSAGFAIYCAVVKGEENLASIPEQVEFHRLQKERETQLASSELSRDLGASSESVRVGPESGVIATIGPGGIEE